MRIKLGKLFVFDIYDISFAIYFGCLSFYSFLTDRDLNEEHISS